MQVEDNMHAITTNNMIKEAWSSRVRLLTLALILAIGAAPGCIKTEVTKYPNGTTAPAEAWEVDGAGEQPQLTETDGGIWTADAQGTGEDTSSDAGWGPGEDDSWGEPDAEWNPEDGLACDEGGAQARREEAAAVLSSYCGGCHSPEGSQGSGGFKDANNIESVLTAQLVIPGHPEDSLVLARMRSENEAPPGQMMPPAKVEHRPSEEEIQMVEKWVECLPTETAPKGEDYVSAEQVLNWIYSDLSTVSNTKKADFRYVTIHHLYNAGDGEETLQRHRDGVAKLVNSLSWADSVFKPIPIDERALVLRLDLDELEWKTDSLGGHGVDAWSLIEEEYPYAVYQDLNDGTIDSIYSYTGVNRTPYVQADWLAARASTAPLYHEILQIPETQSELEELLGVDIQTGISTTSAKRAGFTFSDVSVNNRVIERHSLGSLLGLKGKFADYEGSFWISYDFAFNSGVQNIFNHPVGFVQDGHEIIFNLPNGLQAYMITAANGDRIDNAPVEIVSDSYTVPYNLSPEVTNGLSCISCHFNGMNYAEDEVLDIIAQNPSQYSDEVIGQAQKLYRSPDELNADFDEDTARFEEALFELGIEPASQREEEPVSQLAFGHFKPLSLAEVASAVGLSEEGFLSKGPALERLKQSRAEISTLVNKGGLIKREVFDESFRDITCFMEQGEPVSGGLAPDGSPNSGCAITKFCNIGSPFPNSTAVLVVEGVELQAGDGLCSPCRALPVGDNQAELRFEQVIQVDANGDGKLVSQVEVLSTTSVNISVSDGVEYVLQANGSSNVNISTITDQAQKCEDVNIGFP